MNSYLEPTEILVDATNLPAFDEQQFEGRLERPFSRKSFYRLGLIFLLAMLVLTVRIVDLQIRRGEAFFVRSENNILRQTLIFSPRGIIYDRLGEELAWNVPERRYLDLPGFSHLLGYLNYPTAEELRSGGHPEERIGREGVEEVFNGLLQGDVGLKVEEVDVHGAVLSDHILGQPTAGEPLVLSIDKRWQAVLFREIDALVKEGRFRGGAGAVMDIKTGELLALVSVPEYDANLLSAGGDSEKIKQYLNDESSPFLNRAIGGLFTPGSVIKPLLALAALAEGIISPEKEILSTGALTVPNPYVTGGGTVFRDWRAHGLVDLRRALAVSSNVYFFEIGGGFGDQKGLGISKINQYAEKFGFGQLTGVELTGEVPGLVPSPDWKEKVTGGEPWRLGDTYNASIGQSGWQVTPLQIARLMAAIATDGSLPRPTILKDGNRGRVPERVSDIEPDIYQIVREGMRQAVTEGTAQGLSMPQVEIAAKTGTAEIGAEKNEVDSWVAGFFPYQTPRYVFVVALERAKRSNLIGGVFVMRRVLDNLQIEAPEYFSAAAAGELEIDQLGERG